MDSSKSSGEKNSPEGCRKIWHAIGRIACGGETPSSAQHGAPGIGSKPEGYHQTGDLGNGKGKSSTSDYTSNQVVIVGGPTETAKITGHQGQKQSAKIAATTKPGSEKANKPKLESTLSVSQESRKTGQGHDIDNRFSEFIHRAKLKFRSMSNVGAGKTNHPNAKDATEDRFADFIKRAKRKLRATPSIGGGGGKSFSK